MQRVNYDLIMQQTIKNLDYKPKLLLHSCCAPCSSSVIEKLRDYFDLTVYYYNPNIYPSEEYIIRRNEQKKYLESIGVPFIEGDYDKNEYYKTIQGLELEKEGGLRCYKCYSFRMEKCASVAKTMEFEYFCTTLSVSPHKNTGYINEIGESLEKKYSVKFLYSDYKKRNGYLRSTQISKEQNFYRQNYCGCEYSIIKKDENS